MKKSLVSRETWVRLLFAVFLFVVGYLVGAGIAKTINNGGNRVKAAIPVNRLAAPRPF